MTKLWYQLSLHECPPDESELLSNFLEETGAVSVTFSDEEDSPILEPEKGTMPLWPNVNLIALYDEESLLKNAIKAVQALQPHLNLTTSIIEDQPWERVWMEHFHATKFGERLWICPSWQTPPEPDACNVMFDPGLAFGTGTHPTTALCLQWLDKHISLGQSITDFGCGSGILAISALKLGAKHATAIDIDDQALIATKNNAAINDIAPEQLTLLDANTDFQPTDIIIANILLNPLCNLKAHFWQHLHTSGILVLSGVLSTQVDMLLDTYQDMFTLTQLKHQDEWSLIEFKKI